MQPHNATHMFLYYGLGQTSELCDRISSRLSPDSSGSNTSRLGNQMSTQEVGYAEILRDHVCNNILSLEQRVFRFTIVPC